MLVHWRTQYDIGSRAAMGLPRTFMELRALILLPVLLWLMLLTCAPQSAEAAPLHDMAPAGDSPVPVAIRLLPPQATAAIVIPSLKRLSDEITQCMEGMDRANVLLGSRPIDQIKAVLGLNVGIQDTGSFAIALCGDGVEDLVFIVPVTDADAFLSGNFKAMENGTYQLGQRTIHARPLESHVALSHRASTLAQVRSGQQDQKAMPLQNLLGPRALELMRDSEALILVRREALQQLLPLARAEISRRGLDAALPAQMPAEMFTSQSESLVVALDFDPLALVARSLWQFKAHDDGVAAQQMPPHANAENIGLHLLPDKPYYVALTAHTQALHEPLAARALLSIFGLQQHLERVLTAADTLQFAAYPSPAGIAGGMLNDAVLVLQSSNPQHARESLKQALLAVQQIDDGVLREVNWHDGRAVGDLQDVAAYEVMLRNVPPERAYLHLLSAGLFGRAGWRGYVAVSDLAVVMTFSQRPEVLQHALNTTRSGAAAGTDANLAASPAIAIMRNWFPPRTTFAAFVSPGHLADFVRHAGAGLENLEGIALGPAQALPMFDPALPPLGVGASFDHNVMETAAITPAGVLAAIFDYSLQHMKDSAVDAEHEPQPAGADE